MAENEPEERTYREILAKALSLDGERTTEEIAATLAHLAANPVVAGLVPSLDSDDIDADVLEYVWEVTKNIHSSLCAAP